MALDLLLAFVLAFGPNGSVVAAAMAPPVATDTAVEPGALPTAWIRETLAPLHVVTWSARDATAGPLARERALYLEASVLDGASTELMMLGGWLGSLERPLPWVPGPRLLLRRDVLEWRVDAMPTDVAEAFVAAVLTARLDQLEADPHVEREIARRAAERFASEIEGPSRQRDALREALVAYGAAQLAIAVQIERIWARRGTALCPLIRDGRLLFAHWRRTFEEAPFHGLVASSSPGEGSRQAVAGADARWTRAALTRDDKAWLLREVVGAEWTGDPARDFGRLCG